MVTDLNNTGNRKRIYTKQKNTTSETGNIVLSEKGTHKTMRRYSGNDTLCLPPKYTSTNSTLQSPKKHTHIILTILNYLNFLRTMTPWYKM